MGERAVPNDEMENDLRARWQSQPAQGGKVPLDEVRVQAQRFQKRIRNRNIREYVSAAITCAMFGAQIWLFKQAPVIRVGLVLIVAGVLLMVYQIHKWGASRPVPSDLASASCLEFHRRKLERQRDALQSFW